MPAFLSILISLAITCAESLRKAISSVTWRHLCHLPRRSRGAHKPQLDQLRVSKSAEFHARLDNAALIDDMGQRRDALCIGPDSVNSRGLELRSCPAEALLAPGFPFHAGRLYEPACPGSRNAPPCEHPKAYP